MVLDSKAVVEIVERDRDLGFVAKASVNEYKEARFTKELHCCCRSF